MNYVDVITFSDRIMTGLIDFDFIPIKNKVLHFFQTGLTVIFTINKMLKVIKVLML
jgi:hypothetical protein